MALAVAAALLLPGAAVAQAPPTVSEAFGATSIPVGGTTSLTLTVTNPPGNSMITGVGFSDTLPTNVAITGTNASCPSTSTAGSFGQQSAGMVVLSGASIAGGDTCTYTVNVTGSQAGTQTDHPGNLTDGQGDNVAFLPVAISVDGPPTIAAAFNPASIQSGGTATLTFTLTNPAANPDAAEGVAFTDTLPPGLSVATPNGLSNSCGGRATAATGSTSISLGGGAINSSCALSVSVTSSTAGTFTDTTGPVSSTNGGTGNAASANLTVALPPGISESFRPSAIGQGGTTSLAFTIVNPNSSVTLTGIGFSDSLPSALAVANPNDIADTCGGSVTAPTGASSVSLSGGQLGPGASCTVSFRVLGSTAGRFTNTSSGADSNEGGRGGGSSASLTVIGAPRVTVTSPKPGATYRFGQKVRASYSCADDVNGPGIGSCKGSVPNGALIGTSKAGRHIFTVTATSLDGGSSSDLVFYTVGPSSRFKILNVHVRPNGSVNFRVKVPGAGKIDVVERVGARPSFVFARGHARAKRATTLRLAIRPNARGRQAVKRRRNLRVSVIVGYTPKGGIRRTVRFKFRVPS